MLGPFVPLLNLLVVFEVAEEFAPRDVLLVVDLVFAPIHQTHLIRLVPLNLKQHLIQSEHLLLLTCNFDCLRIDKVHNARFSSQAGDKFASFQHLEVHVVKRFVLTFHSFYLRRQQQTLALFSRNSQLLVNLLLVNGFART